MCTKKFFKVFGLLLVVVLLAAALPTGQAQAATVVMTEADLTAALADTGVTQIELGANIALTSTAYVTRDGVSIDGKGFTITGPSVYHGIDVSGDNVTIKNLTITAAAKSNLQFYRVTGGIVTDVVLSNAGNAGMIVNGSVVTISNVTTSGNAWGGINVDQGSGVTEIPLLTVTNVTHHTSPVAGITPAIWVDSGNASYVAVGDLYTVVSAPNGYLVFYDNAEFATIAANFPVYNVTKDIYYATIQNAITAATAGDTIEVSGIYVLDTVAVLDKAITLTCAAGAKIQVSGTGDRFDIRAAATISSCEIEKTDKTGEQNIIRLNNADASGAKILNNIIHGQFVIGDPEVSRAIVVNAGSLSGVEISGNEIYGLRQPAYISGTHTGVISNNYTHGTRGWVVEGGNLTFTGNTWGTVALGNANVYDIAILTQVGPTYYTDVPAMSAANNNAFIEDQRGSVNMLTPVYVNASAPACASDCGTARAPYNKIQDGIARVIPGGTVHVAAGTYAEQLDITKDISIIGAGAGQSIVQAPSTLPASSEVTSAIVLVHGAGVDAEITGFTITGPGPSGCGSIRAGLYVYDGAYANIHNNNIEDIRDNASPVSGCQNGVAISVGRQFWSTTGTATIANNVIVDYQKGAIVVDNTGSNATITGNTITGAGTISITAQNGIQISRGATATLSGNTVSGNSFHLDGSQWDWGATGVLLYDAGDVAFTGGNNFAGNDSHLYISGAGTVTLGAETFGASTAPVDFGYYVINYNDAPLNLISSTFPTTDPFELASRIWDGIDEAGLGLARWVAGHLYVNPGGSIQRAIDLATAGDTIHVAAGTYAETLTVNKQVTLLGPNSEINPNTGTRGAEAVIVYPDGLTTNNDLVSVSANGVTISGFTLDGKDLDAALWGEGIYSEANNLTVKNNIVKNFRQIGIRSGAGWGGPYYTGALVENNKVTSDVTGIYYTYSGIYLQGTQGVVKGNVVDSAYRGIQIQPYTNPAATLGVVENNAFTAYKSPLYFNYSEHANSDWVFRNNILTGIASLEAAPVDYWSGIVVETFYYGNVVFEKNQVNLGTTNADVIYQYYERGTVNGTRSATPNWWGSILGPIPTKYIGTAAFDPWCGDAACSFLVSATEPAVSGFYVKDGKLILKGAINVTGGIVINEPLYILLEDGTVIQNSSPCFIVNSSNVHIDTESIGGAKCVPTSGANGIDVAAGLNNITIEGIEFDGTGQTTGDGIHFAGAVTDIVLVDNYLHDLDSDGIEFAGDVAEVVNIQGNMFKNNTGFGINNLGATTVGAEYNSWGNVAGPAAGDGVSGLVTSTPFTHADLYVVSSGTPWANQVVKGQNITYTVKAHLVNVNAADFVLTYPAQLTYVSSTASGTLGTASVVHNGTAHTLQFIGYNTANVSGDLPLFSVTFTGATAGANLPLSFSYAATSGFGMVGFESSTNVFVNEMVNGAVTIIDLPTISSTDIQGYYLTGEAREFHVTVDNPSAGGNYAHVIFQFNVTANAGDLSLEYYEGSTWHALPLTCASGVCSGYYGPSTGFPMPNPYSATSLFRVTAAVPGSYPVEIKLLDLDTDPDAVLAIYTNTAVVYDKPSVTSSDIQGYYLVGEARDFHVQVNNPATGGGFTSIFYNFEIANASLADIASLVCDGNTINLQVVGTSLKGSTGPFPMPAEASWNTPCTVNFNTAKTYTFTVSMTDTTPDPDRILQTYSSTANVYTKPTLTSTDITGPYLAGVPKDFHMTVDNPATGGNFGNSIYYVFTIADAELEDIASLSCEITPGSPTTIELTDTGDNLVGRVGYGTAGFPMPADQTWENTCTVKFVTAKSYNFTVDMVDNPSGGPANDRLLVRFQATAVVNGGFDITGTFSMQGRVTRGGIPVTLTWTGTGWTYSKGANTVDELVNNFQVTVTYGGGYIITTNQPRYLNLTEDSEKTITVNDAKTLNALMLRGGNVKNEDESLDKIDINDASLIGTNYGHTGDDVADANFDLRVNIQDLALVGGNFDLTSATAYDSWLPVTLP